MPNQDSKEAISLVKRHDYERMLKQAHDLVHLGVVEHQVTVDSSLTHADRTLLECCREEISYTDQVLDRTISASTDRWAPKAGLCWGLSLCDLIKGGPKPINYVF
jgi:hypothetical protein